MAPKKKETGKALVKWDEKFADYAKDAAQGAKVSEGKFLSFGGGKLSFAGADIPNNEVRCVVVGWMYHNAYYDPKVRYDPDNPQSPICWAFGKTEDEMAPPDIVPDKQNNDCASCPFNEYESATVGKGKACKNTIRLALIAESDLDDIAAAEIIYASISPTSAKNWLVYVTKVLRDKMKRPHWAVITLLKRVPDDKSQFKVQFTLEELIEDDSLFEPLKEIWDSTMETLDFPYQVREAAPAKGGKSAKGAVKQAAAPVKKQKFAKR